MSIVVCRKTRRQFLIGAGNTLLALPFLPSLFPSTAQAQLANANKKMMIFWFDHNALREYWPDRSIATSAIGNSGAREVMLSSLPSATAISSILSHPSYNTLRANNQISILRGMDINPAQGGHGFGPMGGYADFDMGNLIQSANNYPTLDTYIENSLSVYPTATTPASVTKAIRIGFQMGPNYVSKVGNVTQILPSYGYDSDTSRNFSDNYYHIGVLYNDVFRSLTNGTTPPVDNTNRLKTNILNRVQESFTALRSNRRISSDDVARVDQHIGFLADLQRSIAALGTPPPANSCTRPAAPTLSRIPAEFIPRYLDLLVVAFKCGLTKFSTMYFEAHDPSWIPGIGVLPEGMHGAIHGVGAENNANIANLKGQVYETYFRYYMNLVAERFINPMSEQEGNTGRTYLDNMATVILSQMGMETRTATSGHGSSDIQQMLIGSMGGAIRSGRYIALPEVNQQRIPYNAFMITLLQLMGIPISEYAARSSNGQGFGAYVNSAGHPFASRFNTPITEILT